MIGLAFDVQDSWPWLLLLPVGLALGAVVARRASQRTRAWFGEREPQLCGRRRFVALRAALALLAVVAFAVACLRPVTPGRDGAASPDVVLCVDVSRSMLAADAAPTRFEQLRRQARALLDGAIGSRFGLVAFAGDTQVMAPMTADRAAVAWLLDELAPGAIARGGTDLGAAVRAANELLLRAQGRGEIVVLTDGEDFVGDGGDAAAAAQRAGNRVQCIGYGSAAGSKIVVERDGEQHFLQDAAGNDVITRLDPTSLQAMAASGGGLFAGAGNDAQLLTSWREDWVAAAFARDVAAGEGEVVQRFAWPLLVGLLLLMLRMCLPERSR